MQVKPHPNKPFYVALYLAALLALILSLYWYGLSGGFFFDDMANILDVPELQPKEISLNTILDLSAAGIAGPLGRPVSLLTFALNYYFSGFDPFFFKLTNALIHGINAILLYFLMLLFLRAASTGNETGNERITAAAIATLWAIHPIQTTSVLYVVQRMTSLSAMFTLLALFFHVWARQCSKPGPREIGSYVAAWCVFFPLALLSKETGALFLLYVFAYEAILHPRRNGGNNDNFGIWYVRSLSLLGAGFLFYALTSASFLSGYSSRPFTLTERLLTEARVIWEYVGLIVVPTLPAFGLYHDDIALSTGLFVPLSTFLSILGLLVVAAVAFLLRTRLSLVSFSIVWFLLGHSLESTIIPLELMHEHRNYLPSLGIFILILLFCRSVVQYLYSSQSTKPILGVLVLGLATYYGLLTFLRADMYGSDFRRTQVEAQYHPDSVRSHYEAGALMAKLYDGQRGSILYSFANTHFERVNALSPSFKLGLLGMLQLDCQSSNNTRRTVLQNLEERLQNQKWTRDDRIVMHGIAEMANAGTLCLNRGQIDELFNAAAHNPTLSTEDHSVLASDYSYYLWIGQADYPAAKAALSKAVANSPKDALNRLNLLQLMRLLGEKDVALSLYCELETMGLRRKEMKTFSTIKNEMISDGLLQPDGVAVCPRKGS